jgi:hypothetical protein
MKITGKLGTYDCFYQQSGWSYAIVDIRKECTYLFGLIKSTTSVSRDKYFGGHRLYSTAERMLPNAMRNWFQSAVNEYERYTIEWSSV